MIDNNLWINSLIGIGGSSKVYLVSDSDDQKFAAKIVRQDKGYKKDYAENLILREFIIMDKLKEHPNILKWYSWVQEGFVSNECGFMPIMYNLVEYCSNGSLASLIKTSGPFNENVAKFMFLQISHAIDYMHSLNIAHLDIKLENIMLDEYYNTKIADLGSASCLQKSKGILSEIKGTPSYMAPEISEYKGAYNGFKADVYSLGVCLFAMIFGSLPFKDNNEESTSSSDKEMILNKTILNISCELWDSLDLKLRDLLMGMLAKDPAKRLSMAEVMNHAWINEYDANWTPNIIYSEITELNNQEMDF